MLSSRRSAMLATHMTLALNNHDIALRRILKDAPQDLWLDTIRRAKADQHDGLVYWMLNQTECDFAIAVHAFYRSDPARYLDNPAPLPVRPGPSDIFACVLLNWDTGSYRTHKLRVEEVDAPARILSRVNQKAMARPRGSLPFNIPQRFLQPNGGVPLHLPAHLCPDNAHHLWPVYHGLGLNVPESAPGLKRNVARVKVILKKLDLRKSGA